MKKATCRLPAEWEHQDAVLLAWPHEQSDWEPILDEATAVYIELTRHITRHETAVIITPAPGAVERCLQSAAVDLSRVRIYRIDTNDTWIRDFGPLTVYRNNQPMWLDFGFNGWGLKFPADRDNQVSRRLHETTEFRKISRKPVGLILEGGSIESDGSGTLLTTTECLFSPNRNPHMQKKDLEAIFSDLFGSDHFLWLTHGRLAGDDTDSHVDTLARLCPNDTILYVRCNCPEDEHYPELQKMEAQLKSFKTRAGKPYRLLPLPWPQACYDHADRLPATYANFLIINQAVLVPTYNDPLDTAALAAVSEAFPGRCVIGIDCRALIRQHGSLHCVTMQLPQGVLS